MAASQPVAPSLLFVPLRQACFRTRTGPPLSLPRMSHRRPGRLRDSGPVDRRLALAAPGATREKCGDGVPAVRPQSRPRIGFRLKLSVMHRSVLACSTLLLLLPAVTGCRGSVNGDPLTQRSGAMVARLDPEPNPPPVGLDTNFVLTVTENGKPVSAEGSEIALYCISMKQEGPRATGVSTQPGRYEFTGLTTGAPGKWQALVSLTWQGRPPAQFRFPFHVGR